MSALAWKAVADDDRLDTVVEEALSAFSSDIHYLEDMVRVAQRVVAKRAMRSRSAGTVEP